MLRIRYELSSAISYRRKNRIFGDIDNSVAPLAASEILTHEYEKFIPKIKKIFEADSVFYDRTNL